MWQAGRQSFRRLLWSRPGQKRRTGRFSRLPVTEQLETRSLLTGTWSTLSHLAPSATGTMMQLSDGTVMVQGGAPPRAGTN